MQSYIIQVSSRGDGMEEALAATETAGKESGLSRKETLHLRLLAEELFGMVRSLAGQAEGRYALEREEKRFLLRLSAAVTMTQELRKQLIAVSSQGENAAARSFMGKIRDMIAAALLPREDGPPGGGRLCAGGGAVRRPDHALPGIQGISADAEKTKRSAPEAGRSRDR